MISKIQSYSYKRPFEDMITLTKMSLTSMIYIQLSSRSVLTKIRHLGQQVWNHHLSSESSDCNTIHPSIILCLSGSDHGGSRLTRVFQFQGIPRPDRWYTSSAKLWICCRVSSKLGRDWKTCSVLLVNHFAEVVRTSSDWSGTSAETELLPCCWGVTRRRRWQALVVTWRLESNLPPLTPRSQRWSGSETERPFRSQDVCKT